MKGKASIIYTENLTKKYDELIAVDRLNLEIKEGEIYGLLGPNGAGKTTTILMLLGLTEPTEGKVKIAGYDPTKQPLEVKRIVGYLPDSIGFYEDLTGKENLIYIAELNGLQNNRELNNKIEYLLKKVGLSEVGNKKVKTYSRGMRQRLGIADILIKDPKIVILDEPTLGLDPEGIEEMLNLITELSKKDGRTVLISSHLLHQVQRICDRVGIFVKGKLLASGPIDTLGDQVFEDELFQLEVKAKPDNDRLIELFKEIDGVRDIKRHRDKLIIYSTSDIRERLVTLLNEKEFLLLHLRLCGRNLDDIYRRYFEKKGVV
jgi:ABC-2 type transport system ATP-binding protein